MNRYEKIISINEKWNESTYKKICSKFTTTFVVITHDRTTTNAKVYGTKKECYDFKNVTV